MNDKTILEYLKPNDNVNLTSMNNYDINDLIGYLENYYLEYRDNLYLSDTDTFGLEIEFENYDGWRGIGYNKFMSQINSIVGNDKWDVVNDWSLRFGGEIVSEILIDTRENWDKIKNICDFISSLAIAGRSTASHVHVGSQVLGENTMYWFRLFKLWSIYENIIYRFCYGEHFGYRPCILEYARPGALFYIERVEKFKKIKSANVLEMLWCMEPFWKDENYSKKFGLSYWRMLADNNYNVYKDFNVINNGCTVEYRVPNGTFNEIIWQNNINLFIKMMLYCKSNRFNEDILDKRNLLICDKYAELSSYSELYLDQALEFADMIFDNNLDKIYFLKQYIKDIKETNFSYDVIKKITLCSKK